MDPVVPRARVCLCSKQLWWIKAFDTNLSVCRIDKNWPFWVSIQILELISSWTCLKFWSRLKLGHASTPLPHRYKGHFHTPDWFTCGAVHSQIRLYQIAVHCFQVEQRYFSLNHTWVWWQLSCLFFFFTRLVAHGFQVKDALGKQSNVWFAYVFFLYYLYQFAVYWDKFSWDQWEYLTVIL